MATAPPKPLYGISTWRGKFCIANIVICFTVAMIFLGLRVRAKYLINRSYRLHDWLAFIAGLSGVGSLVCVFLLVCNGVVGLSNEQIQFNPEAFGYTLKIVFVSKFFWLYTTIFNKLSIIHFLTTLFTNRRFFRMAAVIATFNVLFLIAYMLETFLLCRPLAYNWDKSIAGGKCGNLSEDFLMPPAANMSLDLLVAILPLPVLWRLHISPKRKVMLSAVLSLGILVCGISVARLVYVLKVDVTNVSANFFVDGVLANVEIFLGTVVICSPLLGPIVFKDRKPNLRDQRMFTSRPPLVPHIRKDRDYSSDGGTGLLPPTLELKPVDPYLETGISQPFSSGDGGGQEVKGASDVQVYTVGYKR